MAEAEPNQAELEELARRMQEELRSLTAAEVLSQSGITLVNIAAARLGMVDGVPDDEPTEARKAIDALGALLPVLEELRSRPAAERSPLGSGPAAPGVRRALGRRSPGGSRCGR